MTPREFAIKCHGEQKYGEHDYVYHLDAVVDIYDEYSKDYPPGMYKFGRQLCFTHDIREDTDATESDFIEAFGEGRGISLFHVTGLLTDEPGKNRKERKMKTYHKIRRDDIAIFVKLCDRVANMREAVKSNDWSHASMYAREYYTFKCALWSPAGRFVRLWAELDKLNDECNSVVARFTSNA